MPGYFSAEVPGADVLARRLAQCYNKLDALDAEPQLLPKRGHAAGVPPSASILDQGQSHFLSCFYIITTVSAGRVAIICACMQCSLIFISCQGKHSSVQELLCLRTVCSISSWA